jgi:hypothetical protein
MPFLKGDSLFDMGMFLLHCEDDRPSAGNLTPMKSVAAEVAIG